MASCADKAANDLEIRQACYAQFLGADDPEVRAAWFENFKALESDESGRDYTPVSNSHDDLARITRGRHCGKFTMNGISLNGAESKYARMNCKCWDCRYCGPRKAKRYRMTIAKEAQRLGLDKFITFTLDPKKLSPESQKKAVVYIKHCWAKMRVLLRRKFGKAPEYICVMEFQHSTKLPHLHIMFDRYVEWEWLRRTWEAVGGGRSVDVKKVDLHRVAHYVAKYLTKELLMSAPKRSRRVTVSKGVTLNGKPEKTHIWKMLAGTIFAYHARLVARVEQLEWGADSVLQSFVVKLSPQTA